MLRLGVSCRFQEQYDKAHRLYVKSLENFSTFKYDRGISACYLNMGALSMARGDTTEAMELFTKCAISIKGKDEEQTIWRLCAIPIWEPSMMSEGTTQKQWICIKKSFSIFEDNAYQAGIGACYLNMGMSYELRSEYDNAMRMCRKGLEIFESLGDRCEMSKCYLNMGNIYWPVETSIPPFKMCEKSFDMAESIGDHGTMNKCSETMGRIYETERRYDKALETYEKCLRRVQAIGDDGGISSCYMNMGIVHKLLGELDLALDMYQRCLDFCRNDAVGTAKAYFNMALIHEAQGKYHKAIELYEKSIKMSETAGDEVGMSMCYLNLGINCKALGETEKL